MLQWVGAVCSRAQVDTFNKSDIDRCVTYRAQERLKDVCMKQIPSIVDSEQYDESNIGEVCHRRKRSEVILAEALVEALHH